MELNRIKSKNGKYYVEYAYKSGKHKGMLCRRYGQIINCKNCGKLCFVFDTNIKRARNNFCSKKCQMRLENNNSWKGGIRRHLGYILILRPNHPFSDKRGYVMEHRLVVEKQIGRYLKHNETIHHINEIKDDNRPENLMAFTEHSKHIKFERGFNVHPKDIIFDGRRLN
jgi:hypothetical protein